MPQVVAEECYGSQPFNTKYIEAVDGKITVLTADTKYKSVTQFFKDIFLPQGYPDSVSDDYTEYQLWDTLQAFCSSITGTLATQAVLRGVGVGDESATVFAATLTWLLKDGTGMVGRIIFAWQKGTYLDCDCKRWRYFADVLNDCAIFTEMLAPLYKPAFRPLVCLAGLAKSVVGVAGGATRAALTQHQARRNNMADVSAKDGSQETLVNLAGLICSLLIIPVVESRSQLVWLLYFVFTILHLYSNFRAVCCVTMETFNETRLSLAVRHFLQHGKVPGVAQINRAEPIVLQPVRLVKIRLGARLQDVFSGSNDVTRLTRIFSQHHFLPNINIKTKTINIALSPASTHIHQLQACFLALLIEHAMTSCNQREETVYGPVLSALNNDDPVSSLLHAPRVLSSLFPRFADEARLSGWSLEPALLCAGEWRAKWSSTDKFI